MNQTWVALFTFLFLLVDTQQQWAMKITLGPLQSHVMSCNLILVNCYGDARGFGIQKGDLLGWFYPTQDADSSSPPGPGWHLFVEDSRKPEVKPSFATIASWESQVIIAIQPPQGLTVTIIYLQPQPPPERYNNSWPLHNIAWFWLGRFAVWLLGKRFWSTKNGDHDLDDHWSSSWQLEILEDN